MNPRISIITRVVFAVVLLVTVFALALGYTLADSRSLTQRLTRINDGYVPVTRTLDEILSLVGGLNNAISERDEVVLRRSLRVSLTLAPTSELVAQKLDELRFNLDRLAAYPLAPEERNLVVNVRSLLDVLTVENAEIAVLTDELVMAAETDTAQLVRVHTELGRRVVSMNKRVSDIKRLFERRIDVAADEVREAESQTRERVVWATAAAGVVALLLAWSIYRALAPIRELTAAAERYKRGDYATRVAVRSHDEIGILAAELSEMAAAISERDGLLRGKNEQLEAAYRELVAAREAQVKVERLAAVGEISSRITHEIRNPLSSIGLNVEMLTEELEASGLESPAAREMLVSIEGEIVRLTQLTERYLTMARSGQAREVTDLAELVDASLRLMAPEFERAGVRLVRDLAPAPVLAKPDEIRQLVINLGSNALSAVREGGGEVRFEVRSSGSECELWIHDDGPGVPAELAGQLFEPFVSGRPGGSGLGLSISRRIVEDHGGRIRVESPGALGGASFVIRLPRADAR